jgi:REP element-mobilizing transposase RayT
MARPKRGWISQEAGSYHIISRVAGGGLLFNDIDKEYFLKLLERFASGFFVRVHAFCVMSSHFHILATGMEGQANAASKKELLQRYQRLYPKNSGPPEGTFDSTYQFIPDADGGIERLRHRLGSISCFVQELKQHFSRWYNKTYDRTGYLWGERFKGVIVSKGEAQLTCSAYIDLNPVRANIVQKPEEYRWSSLGLRVRSAKRANRFLYPLSILPIGGEIEEIEDGQEKEDETRFAPLILPRQSCDHFSTYREFVYLSGSVAKKGSRSIWPELVKDVLSYHGELGISDRFRYRLKNFSEGLAFGSYSLIAHFQKLWKRKHICPRSFMDRDKSCNWSFTTRVLRL